MTSMLQKTAAAVFAAGALIVTDLPSAEAGGECGYNRPGACGGGHHNGGHNNGGNNQHNHHNNVTVGGSTHNTNNTNTNVNTNMNKNVQSQNAYGGHGGQGGQGGHGGSAVSGSKSGASANAQTGAIDNRSGSNVNVGGTDFVNESLTLYQGRASIAAQLNNMCTAVTGEQGGFQLGVPGLAGFGADWGDSEVEYVSECAQDMKAMQDKTLAMEFADKVLELGMTMRDPSMVAAFVEIGRSTVDYVNQGFNEVIENRNQYIQQNGGRVGSNAWDYLQVRP